MFEGSFSGVLGLDFFLVFFNCSFVSEFFVGNPLPHQLLKMVNSISEY